MATKSKYQKNEIKNISLQICKTVFNAFKSFDNKYYFLVVFFVSHSITLSTLPTIPFVISAKQVKFSFFVVCFVQSMVLWYLQFFFFLLLSLLLCSFPALVKPFFFSGSCPLVFSVISIWIFHLLPFFFYWKLIQNQEKFSDNQIKCCRRN